MNWEFPREWEGEAPAGPGRPFENGFDRNRSSDESGPPPFRFASSMRMFSGVNENDAKADVRGRAQGLAKERAIRLDGRPVTLQNLAEIIKAMRNKRVDRVSITTGDYPALAPDLQAVNLLSRTNGNP